MDKFAQEIQRLIQNKLPRIAGKLAVDHFRENFEKGGFVDHGLNKWKPAKRIKNDAQYAGQKYGTLLSARKELYNSISYKTDREKVIILSDKEYARIHNEGGTVNPQVTEKMRNYAWSQHIKQKKQTGKKDSMWKGIALTQKDNLTIQIPQRQFIGHSKELDDKIEQKLDAEIHKILGR